MVDEVKSIGQTCGYNLIYVFRLKGANEGLVKVGKASLTNVPACEKPREKYPPNCPELNDAADKRIREYSTTLGFSDRFKILHTRIAIDDDGKSFTDKRVHRVLEKSGFPPQELGGAREWFKIEVETARKAIDAAVRKKPAIEGYSQEKRSPINFRKEQDDAIERALERFREGGKQFLWNAKMRFGKTLCAMEVVRQTLCSKEVDKRVEFKKTIIVTHLPVIKAGWFEDFDKIFRPYEEYDNVHVGSKKGRMSLYDLKESGNPFVYFASIQDLRGSEEVVEGGKDTNNEVFSTDWDLVIVDEAHLGTTTPLGEDVINKLVKPNTRRLSLSGTPFNIMERYSRKETFVWDYVKEQKYKEEWDEKHPGEYNPYEELPRLNIWTYSLGELLSKAHKGKVRDAVHGEYVDIADKCFNFREFFKTEKGKFVHSDDIDEFLSLLSTRHRLTKLYPFANEDFSANFQHSLWVLPGVDAAAALEEVLNHYPTFKNYYIINVAGEENSNNPLKRVQDAIKKIEEGGATKYIEDKKTAVPAIGTITLSCGRLTTGVTIPEWTAVLYLAGSYETSVSSYLQAIFRVQTPGSVNGQEKKECYAFDFAPDRVLSIFDQLAHFYTEERGYQQTLNEDGKTTALTEYLNYLPVISFDGSTTLPIDEEFLLEQVSRMSVAEVMRSGFHNYKLFNNEMLFKLTKEDIDAFQKIGEVIGRRGSSKGKYNQMRAVTVTNTGLTGVRTRPSKGSGNQSNKSKDRTHNPEQKQQIKNHDIAIDILRDVSTRIPLLVFGAGAGKTDDELEKDFFDAPEKFPDNFDDDSWREFMGGLSKDDFKKTVARFLDSVVFKNACLRIRERTKEADSLPVIKRIGKIVGLHSEFKNPDKETVLTPWKTVNMHLGGTLGGYSFFGPEKLPQPLTHPDDTLGSYNFFDEEATYEQDYLKEAEESDEDAKTLFRTTKATAKTLKNPKAKILEINSKTGLYPLYVAYSLMRERLQQEEGESIADAERRTWKKVVKENLFIICQTEMAAAITHRTLLGFDKGTENEELKPNIFIVKNLAEKARKLIPKENNGNTIWEELIAAEEE